ncbi:MAG TPA: kelch repeat-containing protein, partial [Blastocatellia bacterium]|nr:kelch repeat-containing protein [Blastocatellia bacterium]
MNKPPFLPSLVIRVVRSNKLTASTSRRLTLALIAVVVAGLAATSAAPPAAHFFAGTSPTPPAAVRLRTRVPARPAVAPRASAQADDATARGRAELNIERRGHVAIALGNGKVLIIGGENERGLVKKSELFDLGSKSFSLAAELISRRTDAVAIKLPDGRVMVLGGRNQKGELKSTEIYDSESNSFTRGPKMVHARAGHTATELADGRILIAGGNARGSAEIFDPSSLRFSRVAARMQSPRSAHSAILLNSGKVLIAGGLSIVGGEVRSGEIFDPETMQFSATRNAMKGLRTRPTLRVLPDGKVQVIGGDDARSMEMFNVEGRYFTAQAHLVPGDNSQTGLAEVMRAKTQAGLFHKTDRESFKLSRVPFGDRSKDQFSRLQDLMAREETLGDVLDRSEYTITELPGSEGTSGGVIVTGGITGSGKVLRTTAALESSGATVTTDKTDYQPGDTVIISGTGWQPGETVNLNVHRDNDQPPDTLY